MSFWKTFCAVACFGVGAALHAVAASSARGQSIDLPLVPVGDDAYLQWDRMAYHRIGVRAYMRSTYDRTGGNRDADASHFLYQQADDFNVTLDAAGPGVLYFVRTNHHHGSPWHYEIDGADLIVKESATDDPVGASARLSNSNFIPEALFPHPLAWTWPTTKGADLMWQPIPFAESLRLAYSRTFYGTGYYIYHLFPRGADNLSRPVATWDRQPPDPRVLELLSRAGEDLAPTGAGVAVAEDSFDLEPDQWRSLPCPGGAPATLRALKFTLPRDAAHDFGRCRLRITWDDRWHASVDAPVDLFFGAGRLHNPDGREYLVRGLPLAVRYRGDQVELACYWPMPFFEQARIELQNRSGQPLRGIRYEARTVAYRDPPSHVGYFHATYTDHPHPAPGADLTFLDTAQAEGGGPWSGNFVGMTWTFTDRGRLGTLEGDPRLLFDGSRTPQGWGTGTEEWGGGGDYWGGRNMTIPLAGHPVGKEHGKHQSERDLVNSAYRFLIADLFPFGNRAVINLEHGGGNLSREHYSGVAYWYGSPRATLVLTDELNVCDRADGERHGYRSPTAERPYQLVSRYEVGPDSDAPAWWNEQGAEATGARQFFPAEEDAVRTMHGTSEFTLRLDPDNHGVLLRRKFDYQYPNQRAKVYVRPAAVDGNGDPPWQYVGQWYTAGSNTCVHSRPPGDNFSAAELAPTEHNVVTSNRRWREEEFLIARRHTRGVARLGIRLEHVPDDRPLYPGRPFPVRNAWSESRYWAYCYVFPGREAVEHANPAP
ncbi:MAG: hypothetical protein DCC67_06800 [Planctomycetota bacterium]|nr:MAG: hypothetical protein DCC67_06800 [Planctomycetota bacterium]